jgi:hypothetical protein
MWGIDMFAKLRVNRRWYSSLSAVALVLLGNLCALCRAEAGANQSTKTPESDVTITSDYPADVDDGTPDFSKIHDPLKIPESQRLFDRFAWQTFTALNWAGKKDGTPDTNVTLEEDAKEGFIRPRTWEMWAETNMLFKANGADPALWNIGSPPQWGAGVPLDAKDEVVWMTAKIHNRNARDHTSLADENIQAFTAPLVDQNGNWVRYQVRVNRTEYNFVRTNRLYNLEGQSDFLRNNAVIEFPKNGETVDGEKMTHGSTEIKVSWKQLGQFEPPPDFMDHKTDDAYLKTLGLVTRFAPDQNGQKVLDHYDVQDDAAFAAHITWFDDRGRFLWRYVRIIHNGGIKDANGIPVPDPVPVPLGVVGMHIAVRTVSSPQWIWTTFEQADNVTVNDLHWVTLPDGSKKRLRPSFFNPDRPADVVNLMPLANITPDPVTGKFTDWDETKTTKPVQVLRVLQIPPATAELNQIEQSQFRKAGSVLQYYELVGAQWPVEPKLPAYPSGVGSAPESIQFKVPGHVVPTFVVNTTMETYFQGGNQIAGPDERDDRPPSAEEDPTMAFATESCVGCHYSAGACIDFKLDGDKPYRFDPATGKYVPAFLLKDGRKVPIFGLDSHQGHTGNANFSWLLQMKAQSTQPPAADAVIAATRPGASASINTPTSDPQQIAPLNEHMATPAP